MKRKISCFIAAFALCLALLSGCAPEGNTAYIKFKEAYVNYVSSFSEATNPKIRKASEQYAEEIRALSYDSGLTAEENKIPIREKMAAFADAVEDVLVPAYKADIDTSLYMTESGYIKGDPTLASFGGYSEGKGDFYLAANTPAVFTDEVLDKIDSLADETLKTRLYLVTTANQIYAETIISFTGTGEVMMSNLYTPLGIDLMREVFGKEVIYEQAEICQGTYDKLPQAKENTNDCYFTVDFGNTEMPFVFNARNGSVSRQDLFRREVLPIYTSVMAAENGAGGYNGGTDFEEGTEKYLDVEYGDRAMEKTTPDSSETRESRMREKMDVFVPADLDTTRENGVIMMIHGGSWVSGSKEDMHNVCAEYTNAGYITVAINYTYMGKKFEDGEVCTFLTMNDEIKAAFAKVKEMSEQYGWNITKAATTGYSAGCHLALYYAYTHGNEQDAPIPVVFASGLVGPLDFHQEYWKDTPLSGPAIAATALNDPNIFDGEKTLYDEDTFNEKLDCISPLAYAQKGDAVPTLVGYGMMDKSMVNYYAAVALEEALTKYGIENSLILFANSNHLMGNNPECGRIYRERVTEYAKKYFGH